MTKKMLKTVASCFFIFFISIPLCFSEILGERFTPALSEEDFDVNYYVYPNMKIKENLDELIDATQIFEITEGKHKAELRYLLFKDNGGLAQLLSTEFSELLDSTIFGMTEDDLDFSRLAGFNPKAAKQEFNADAGYSLGVFSTMSYYQGDYRFMLIDTFYKQNEGVVFRTLLIDSLEFLGYDDEFNYSEENDLWKKIYHSFRFMD